ncbi:Hsp20/alpha crystallin family protein [Natronoglomus mannanivorans]|uniref:Hsp20/alpha crystallin family protein n=1 Tax=Natronoglomus mannanivorans TaxID=2979990 RepID=A0AAP2Z3S8_9EURY|nr:Hsp20/alpha crystallin family protein [Halobacteria archaeon AArc-xg1-1]
MRSFDDMNRLFREMDRTFDQFRASWWNEYAAPGLESASPSPASALEGSGDIGDDHEARHAYSPSLEFGGDTTVSLEEEGDAYRFVMDIPGFEKEDIDLTLDDGILSVRARRDVEEESDTYHTAGSRRVSRQIPIPKELVLEDVTATYRNGVLEVHLPIVETERDSSHRIDIE